MDSWAKIILILCMKNMNLMVSELSVLTAQMRNLMMD